MKTAQAEENTEIVAQNLLFVTGSHRRTLEAIFRHPSAHNLEWREVVALIGKIGEVQEKGAGEFAFEVAGERHVIRRTHGKDLTGSQVLELRRFLTRAEVSAEPPSEPHPPSPDLLVVVDHHGAKIFEIDIASHDASEPMITPHDFPRHLTHRDQTREQGQRAPEEPGYYETIGEALALGDKIVVVGHGTGKSNAARDLSEYLKTHHHETYERIVREIVADLSGATDRQLLDLAREALGSSGDTSRA